MLCNPREFAEWIYEFIEFEQEEDRGVPRQGGRIQLQCLVSRSSTTSQA